MASRQGFEPRLTVLETAMLPLHYRDMTLERVERIELSTNPWQGLGLPLHHTRIVLEFCLAVCKLRHLTLLTFFLIR